MSQVDAQAASTHASLTIIKDAQPDHPQDFSFLLSEFPGGGERIFFSLDDDSTSATPNTITIADLGPDIYSLEEFGSTGWALISLTCDDPDGGTSIDLLHRTAWIDLDAGENITCTFVNTNQGSITIVKDAQPDDPQDFNFIFSILGDPRASFTLDDDDASATPKTHTLSGVGVGSYEMTEVSVAGWYLSDIQCSDPDGGTFIERFAARAIIDVDAGESIICTFVNTKRGSITIIKDTQPDDPQDFNFIFSILGDPRASFTLDDDIASATSNTHILSNLTAGDSYEIKEVGVAGWKLIDIQCNDSDGETSTNLLERTATIDLDPGENITCTFVNTNLATITVIKDAQPDDPQDFSFGVMQGTEGLATFLDDDSDPTRPNSFTVEFAPGDILVREGAVAGWTLDGIVCDRPVNSTNLAQGEVEFTLAVGEHIICTFTNVRDSRPPDAVDDNATVNEDSANHPIDVLANDSDPDFDLVTITAISDPAHGAAVINGNWVEYTPDADYNGPDSFTYTIEDGNGGSDTATVIITVNPVNDPPDAVGDSASVNQNSSGNLIEVLANDSDPDFDPLTIVAVSDPAHGTVVIVGNLVEYTPDPGYNGPDSFTYTISDGRGGTDTVIVNIIVNIITQPGGNNGVGNGLDPQPPGNPPINDGPGTGPGNPGNKGGQGKGKGPKNK